MFGASITEVMLGLIFVYILLSLLVSQVNQIVANILDLRARQLRVRLEDVLLDEEIERKLLSHPLVGVLKPPRNDEDVRNGKQQISSVTSLPSKTFAQALINILSDPYLDAYAAITQVENIEERENLRNILNQLKAYINEPSSASAVFSQFSEAVHALEPTDREDRRALLRTLGPLQNAIRNIQTGNSGLLMILDGVNRVNNRAFQQAMESILSTVQNFNEAEIAIEEWYENKMAQTRNLYARTMQYMSLVVGLIFAVVLNIDSLYLARTLWNDSALRDQVSSAAVAAAVDPNFEATINSDGEITASGDFDAIIASYQAAELLLEQLLELRLPIGWVYRTPEATVPESEVFVYDPTTDGRNLYNLIPFVADGWLLNILTKITGLAITSFAVAQGAPFWFDLLRRITGQNKRDEEDRMRTTE